MSPGNAVKMLFVVSKDQIFQTRIDLETTRIIIAVQLHGRYGSALYHLLGTNLKKRSTDKAVFIDNLRGAYQTTNKYQRGFSRLHFNSWMCLAPRVRRSSQKQR